MRSGQVVRRSVHHGVPTPGIARHALRTLSGTREVLRHYANWRSRRAPDMFGIHVMAEQAPTATSRVRLGRRVDRLGLPVTVLDWRLNRRDLDSIRQTVDIFGESVRRAGVGDRDLDPWSGRAAAGDLRQLAPSRDDPDARDPTHGVVDENCRVHGMANLYIAGGSVVPHGRLCQPDADHRRHVAPPRRSPRLGETLMDPVPGSGVPRGQRRRARTTTQPVIDSPAT